MVVSVVYLYISCRDEEIDLILFAHLLVYEVQVMMKDSSKVNAVFLCISCKCEPGCLHFPFSDE